MNRSLKDISKTVAKNTPRAKDIVVNPWRLEVLLTRTLVPTLGLHAALISALFLFQSDRAIFGYLAPLFAFCWFISLGTLLLRGQSNDEIAASRLTNATFGFGVISLVSVLSLLGLEISENTTVFAFAIFLVALYVIIAILCWREFLQPLSLVVIGIYTAAFFQFLQPVAEFISVIAVTTVCFGIGAYVVIRKRRLGYLLGFVVGALVVIVVGVGGDIASSSIILTGFAALAILGLIIQQIATSKVPQSDFTGFLEQGLAIAIIGFAAFNLFDGEETMVLTAMLVVFSVFTLVLFSRQGVKGLASRLLWITLVSWALIGTILGSDTHLYLNVAATLAMLIISILLQSGFVRFAAIITAIPVLFRSLLTYAERMQDAVAANTHEVDNTTRPLDNADWSVFIAPFFSCIFVLAMILLVAVIPNPKTSLPWWRGIVRPRYAAVIRNIYRSVRGKISNAPIIGWIWSFGSAVFTWIRFLKGKNQTVGMRDLLDISVCASAAIATFILLESMAETSLGLSQISDGPEKVELIAFLASWSLWGLILCLRGRRSQSTFHVLLGVVFLLVPLFIEIATGELLAGLGATGQIWPWLIIVFSSGSPIFLMSLVPEKRTEDANRAAEITT